MFFEKIISRREFEQLSEEQLHQYRLIVVVDCSNCDLSDIYPGIRKIESIVSLRQDVLAIISKDREFSDKIFIHIASYLKEQGLIIHDHEKGRYIVIVSEDSPIKLVFSNDTQNELAQRQKIIREAARLIQASLSKEQKKLRPEFLIMIVKLLQVILPKVKWLENYI